MSGALIGAAETRYALPNSNGHALTGVFAPNLSLQTEQGATSVAELMHAGHPILLDLANRSEVREAARDWLPRIAIHTAETDDRPADGLLIRPDGHIAWAATIDEPAETAAHALHEALSYSFGSSLRTTDSNTSSS